MSKKRVVVVGSGGREHAIASVLGRHAEVVVTPGNPGIAGSISTKPEELEADLFVIGPEQPLVDGLADRLRAQGKLVFGPNSDGARLEGSKAWMKEVLRDAGVPTADFHVVSNEKDARTALDELRSAGALGWAIKTDGLAAGKGVTVTRDIDKAMDDVRAKLSGSFNEAGQTLVIEALLASESDQPSYEVSIFAICNGDDFVLLEGAQDYKLLNANSELNTGGMGAYSPTRDQSRLAEWAEIAIRPTLKALKVRGIDYRGVLYAGLMIVDGNPFVLEFNIRFGDPETEVVLPRITSNLVEVLTQAAEGKVMDEVAFGPDVMVGRVLAAENYPDSPRTGDVIVGIDQARAVPGVEVFCAGVSSGKNGELVTAGGRVLVVTARGLTAKAAIDSVARATKLITWPGQQSRDDIGRELLEN